MVQRSDERAGACVCCLGTQCGESLAGAAETRTAEAELLNVVRVDVVHVYHCVQLIVVRVQIELSPRHTQKAQQYGDEEEATHSGVGEKDRLAGVQLRVAVGSGRLQWRLNMRCIAVSAADKRIVAIVDECVVGCVKRWNVVCVLLP